MDDFETYEFQAETFINKSTYNHSKYLNLIKSCKSYGYVKIGKGKPSYQELYTFLYANFDNREPIPERIPIKYDTRYYFNLVSLAQWNGFVFKKVGKVSMDTLQEYLDNNGISYPVRPVKSVRKKWDINLYLQ